MGEQVNIEQLYHKSWFRPFGLSTLLFILYLPIGICLLIIRAFILLQFFLLAFALPPSKFRQKCLRVMNVVLGLSVSTEGEADLTPGKIFVANHITNCDHLAVHLTTGASLPSKERLPRFISRPLALIELTLESLTKEQVDTGEPLILFPEGETTNGEVGVLAFSAVEIPEGVTIQPVAIKVSRVFMNSTSVSGTFLQEIFVALISPNTHFLLRFLPTEVADSEGLWKRKTQSAIAQSLGLTATKLNTSDKAEFVKRLFFRPPSLATMVREVQKQLSPQTISPELIITTLQRTGSVEGTLESLRQSCPAGTNNPPPSTFSKNANQRMMSFQERKRIMIAAARQAYIDKHGLSTTQTITATTT